MRRLALGLLLVACGTEDAADEEGRPGDAATGSGADAATAPEADAAAGEPDAASPAPPVARLSVFNTLGFATEVSPGVAPGFDLDDRVSDSRDVEGCRKADLRAPDGTPGIDNALAKLVPLFTAAGLGAAESLAQSLIEEGGLLLMVQIDGVDDPQDDDDVTLYIRAGQGDPLLGTDGLLLSGQTFDVHADSPDSVAAHARIVDGFV